MCLPKTFAQGVITLRRLGAFFTSQRLEYLDTLFSILQRIAVIAGIIAGAFYFFKNEEHRPLANASLAMRGFIGCNAIVEITTANIGRVPLNIKNVLLLPDGLPPSNALYGAPTPQQINAGEVAASTVEMPVTLASSGKLMRVRLSIKLAEDERNTWRVTDEFIKLENIPADCS